MSKASKADPSLIRNSPLGEELSDEQCARLAELTELRQLGDGELLIEEGAEDDRLYVITRGRLEVCNRAATDDWVTLHVLRAGELVGELSFIDGLQHVSTLRALSECEVFSISREDFEALLEEDARLVYAVMRAIMRTVHATLRRMNFQYVEMTNYIYKRHGRY